MQLLFYRFNQNKLVHNKLQIPILQKSDFYHNSQQREEHWGESFLRLLRSHLNNRRKEEF